MAGTYNGGGTLIGPGLPWHIEKAFDTPVASPTKSAHQPLSQAKLLKALGYSKSDLKPKKLGCILKCLVADGLLDKSGKPNADHPKIRELLRHKKKRSKPGVRIGKKTSQKLVPKKVALSTLPDNEEVQRAGKRVRAIQTDIETSEKRLATLKQQLSIALDQLKIAQNLTKPINGP